MKNYLDQQCYLYKLCCDGLDFVTNTQFKFSSEEILYAKNHTIINDFSKIQEFYNHVISQSDNLKNLYPIDLISKYEMGYFKVELGHNFHPDYILFSDDNIKKWEEIIPIIGLEFLVAFSRGNDGNVNGFGMRLLNNDKLLSAFKWLFPMGQHCTFGLHNIIPINNSIVTVEGFTDYIAFRESGYNNVIGLGSAVLEPAHQLILQQYSIIQCPDQDAFGMSLRRVFDRENIPYCYYTPNAKDPYESFLKNGNVNMVYVQN